MELKLTVLLDNNTFIDRYFYGEPGVSYFIEDEGFNILFDTGYSDAFIKNANKMNIDLRNINSIVISHGHIDHTRGLVHLITNCIEGTVEKTKYNMPSLIAHPLTFEHKEDPEEGYIGSILGEEKLNKYFNMRLSKEPIWLTDKLVFLGEIARENHFENKTPVGKTYEDGKEIDDYVLDDSALAYKSLYGIVIITGCSHAGICNIIEYAKKVCGDDRIVDVIGGFHLLNPSENVIKSTCDYMRKGNVKQIHAAHCTDLKSKIELAKAVEVNEVGVGLVLEYK